MVLYPKKMVLDVGKNGFGPRKNGYVMVLDLLKKIADRIKIRDTAEQNVQVYHPRQGYTVVFYFFLL